MYYTCSSGRDKSSIQACSKSGDILCDGSWAGEGEVGNRVGCSGDIMTLLLATEIAAVPRSTEVSCGFKIVIEQYKISILCQ